VRFVEKVIFACRINGLLALEGCAAKARSDRTSGPQLGARTGCGGQRSESLAVVPKVAP
jgi:hypothetical protein